MALAEQYQLLTRAMYKELPANHKTGAPAHKIPFDPVDAKLDANGFQLVLDCVYTLVLVVLLYDSFTTPVLLLHYS